MINLILTLIAVFIAGWVAWFALYFLGALIMTTWDWIFHRDPTSPEVIAEHKADAWVFTVLASLIIIIELLTQ